jgi:hypothetical protein
MTPRQVIGLDGVLDENCSAVLENKLSFAVVVDATEQAGPGFFEVGWLWMKLPDRVTDKVVALHSQNVEHCWICFDTGSHVIKDQNAIESVIENGLEFAFRGIEDAGGFAMFAARQNQEAGMQEYCCTERDQRECEQ